MVIQPIVEGYGDVEAVPILLRRLREMTQVFDIEVGKPIRQKRSALIQQDLLRRAVRLALLQAGVRAILILFDADDACPAHLAPVIQAWAQAEAGTIPAAVVIACREYEAWFLGSIESLRGFRGILPGAIPHPDPEFPRDAKGQLEERMQAGQSYSETTDQPAMTATFDMAAAYGRCRSFRRMIRAFGILVSDIGLPIQNWPPPAWTVEE
jgi:hypothetical protein